MSRRRSGPVERARAEIGRVTLLRSAAAGQRPGPRSEPFYRDEALALVRKNQLTYPVLMDPEGEIGLLYGAFSTPTVYLIDRKGTVLARMWGPAGWYSPEARKLIAALVEQN